MKKIIYLFVFIIIHETVFSQAKLHDGIYLVDQKSGNHVSSQPNKSVIQFNPFFIEGDPEAYDPMVIFTDDFVAFELADIPVVQYQKRQQNLLMVHLTENATEKLKTFTTKNMMNQVAVVVDGQALAIYKVTQPVTSGCIKIARCSGSACNLIYKQLKSTIKI